MSKAKTPADGAKEQQEQWHAQMKAVKAAKKTQMLNIIKNLGDSITAS